MSTQRYSPLSIGLHWLMLLLMAAVYATIELKGNFPKGSDTRELLKHWHFMLGLGVFALVWLRLLARWVRPVPRQPGRQDTTCARLPVKKNGTE